MFSTEFVGYPPGNLRFFRLMAGVLAPSGEILIFASSNKKTPCFTSVSAAEPPTAGPPERWEMMNASVLAFPDEKALHTP